MVEYLVFGILIVIDCFGVFFMCVISYDRLVVFLILLLLFFNRMIGVFFLVFDIGICIFLFILLKGGKIDKLVD